MKILETSANLWMSAFFPNTLVMTGIAEKDYFIQWKENLGMQFLALGNLLLVCRTVLEGANLVMKLAVFTDTLTALSMIDVESNFCDDLGEGLNRTNH